ncbi:ferredoxin [Acetohalobium arabaticum]|uniref:Ferredoxin n=1 Tax=Acetohalobium arabaticum (strain ATCC 49924 / DSM 5501 / Z-7288) TaxID=574087 RepID=D9QPI5_ACEAZ|nr:ferredoxin [Acetohalobium arabaticum]ADL12426.1 4Fe-4S ferredoxin iron-sulfur binding domain protein [Acetohalobium arabaticum DSM 5501]
MPTDTIVLEVDPELCISCGLCIEECPAVFDWGDDDKAVAIVDTIPEKVQGDAIAAQEGCPTDAIKDA